MPQRTIPRHNRVNHKVLQIRDKLALSEIDEAISEMQTNPPPHLNTFCGGAYRCGNAQPDCLYGTPKKCYFD